MSITPRPWPEVQEILPPLSASQRALLERDIGARGVLVPVLCLPDGRIIDGHHRWELSGGTAPVEVLALDEREALAVALRLNVHRRHLTIEQQKEIAAELRCRGWTQQQVADLLGVDQSTLAKREGSDMKIHNASPPPDLRYKIPPAAKLEIAERVRRGEPTRLVAADYGISQRRVRQIVKQVERSSRPEDQRVSDVELGLRRGDFREVLRDLPSGSVALILTDPPYAERYAELYVDLARFAADKLAEGGSLVSYCGQHLLPHVLEAFGSAGLRYHWTLALLHRGGNEAMPAKRVFCGWKPIIWFVKGSRRTDGMVADIVPGHPPNKADHPWAQGQGEAAYLIEQLTRPGDLVVDPFAGSGTVGYAARELGRRFAGAEIQEPR